MYSGTLPGGEVQSPEHFGTKGRRGCAPILVAAAYPKSTLGFQSPAMQDCLYFWRFDIAEKLFYKRSVFFERCELPLDLIFLILV